MSLNSNLQIGSAFLSVLVVSLVPSRITVFGDTKKVKIKKTKKHALH